MDEKQLLSINGGLAATRQLMAFAAAASGTSLTVNNIKNQTKCNFCIQVNINK